MTSSDLFWETDAQHRISYISERVSTTGSGVKLHGLVGRIRVEIAADSGVETEKWKKQIPTGGVLGCAALANGLAVFTCTDGKVRAFALKDGERRLLYDAKAPLFAPPAVVGDVAYVADLKGVVHAVDLKSGSATWTLDIGAEVKAPGMVYGGIAVHDGKLFVATCNLEGQFARQGTAVVCIGQK